MKRIRLCSGILLALLVLLGCAAAETKGSMARLEKKEYRFTLKEDSDVVITLKNTTRIPKYNAANPGRTKPTYEYFKPANYLIRINGLSAVKGSFDERLQGSAAAGKTWKSKVYSLAKGSYVLRFSGKALKCCKQLTYTIRLSVTPSPALSPSEITLLKGEKQTLSVANADGLDKTWSSSNPKVATVTAKGTVKAVGPGTAVITCRLDSGRKLQANVTVYGLSASRITLATGAEKRLTVNGADGKKIVWSSSDPSVATVGKTGTVKAVGAGSADIVASVSGAANKPLTVHVTVPGKLNIGSKKTLSLMDEFIPLKLAGAKEKYTFTSSNPSVADVDENNMLIPQGPGTAVITCTTESGAALQCQVTVVEPVTVKSSAPRDLGDGVWGADFTFTNRTSGATAVYVCAQYTVVAKKNGKTVRATAGTDEYSVTLAPHQSCTFTEAQIQCLLPEAYRDAVVSITDVHIYRAMFSDGSSYENR